MTAEVGLVMAGDVKTGKAVASPAAKPLNCIRKGLFLQRQVQRVTAKRRGPSFPPGRPKEMMRPLGAASEASVGVHQYAAAYPPSTYSKWPVT